jgi:hypothetical protein
VAAGDSTGIKSFSALKHTTEIQKSPSFLAAEKADAIASCVLIMVGLLWYFENCDTFNLKLACALFAAQSASSDSVPILCRHNGPRSSER